MSDNERLSKLLNTCCGELTPNCPKSPLIRQKNRSDMPAAVGSMFRLADPYPMVKQIMLFAADNYFGLESQPA